jgi:hypothetical protein
MAEGLLPTKKKKRQLTEKQLAYLDALMDNGGNNAAALRVAGYCETTGKAVMNSLADEIVERAKNMLAANSVKAAAGVGKHDKVEHNVTAIHGVVLLPAKSGQVDPVIIDHE